MPETPDLAARLARSLTRSAHAPLRSWRLVMLAALVLVTGLCAVWAVAERHGLAGQAADLWALTDYLYAPFLYLVPDHNLADASRLSAPQLIARITGPLIPLLGLFWLVRQRLLLWLAAMLANGRMRGHAVVLGMNGSADPLALESSAAGSVVVLVDPSLPDDVDRQQALASAGVIAMTSPPVSMATASSVVVWQGHDAENIATAAALRADHSLGVEEIDLSVNSHDLNHALIQVPDLMLDRTRRLRPHSVAAMAVRAAMAGPELPRLALDLHQSRVTLCMWGMSDVLVCAAELTLQHFWCAQLGAPRVVWVDSGKVVGGSVALPKALAGIARNAEQVFGEAPGCPAIEIVSAEQALADPLVTCHLVDADDAEVTLAQTFALAAGLQQIHFRPAPARAVLDTKCAIDRVFANDQFVFMPPIIPGVGLTVQALRNRAADEQAAQLHLAYDRAFGGGGTAPASGRWQDLPETYVAANRAAADHRAIKQWDAVTSGLEGEALIETLARAEHNRWCAERLLSGWAPSGEGPRDNARRLHPDLRPWETLSEAAQEKDREVVRGLVQGP